MIHRDTGVAPDEVYTAAEEFGEIFLLRFFFSFDGSNQRIPHFHILGSCV